MASEPGKKKKWKKWLEKLANQLLMRDGRQWQRTNLHLFLLFDRKIKYWDSNIGFSSMKYPIFDIGLYNFNFMLVSWVINSLSQEKNTIAINCTDTHAFSVNIRGKKQLSTIVLVQAFSMYSNEIFIYIDNRKKRNGCIFSVYSINHPWLFHKKQTTIN